jgi:hypothetical protein
MAPRVRAKSTKALTERGLKDVILFQKISDSYGKFGLQNSTSPEEFEIYRSLSWQQ